MESDPTGRSQHEPGAKLDSGKNRVGLVLMDFSGALLEVGKVGTYGAQKYTDHGWKEVPNGVERYTDALFRHILAETESTYDDASGMVHAACVAWNALARLQKMIDEEML